MTTKNKEKKGIKEIIIAIALLFVLIPMGCITLLIYIIEAILKYFNIETKSYMCPSTPEFSIKDLLKDQKFTRHHDMEFVVDDISFKLLGT